MRLPKIVRILFSIILWPLISIVGLVVMIYMQCIWDIVTVTCAGRDEDTPTKG